MRIGIVILPDRRWSQARERWRRAEEYGFAHAWTYDHLGWRDLVDGPWFDAAATLTAAATVTSRIGLGTLVASPNFRHPAHFAREVTTIDDISDGRLMLGIGAGGAGFDAEVLGRETLSAGARVDRYTEFVTLLDRLLREEQVTSHGTYFSAVDARTTPGCVQTPRVPFILAAGGKRSMRLAATLGDGWVTTGGQETDVDSWWGGVAEQAERFSATLADVGRGVAAVDRYLLLDPAGPVYSLSSAAYFAESVARAQELGFTDVITSWPRESSWFAGDEAVLEEVVATVLPQWASGD